MATWIAWWRCEKFDLCGEHNTIFMEKLLKGIDDTSRISKINIRIKQNAVGKKQTYCTPVLYIIGLKQRNNSRD